MINFVPKISVVMPVYNGAPYIEMSINSILNQTFDSFELIIVDDASTDNTVPIIQQFKDDRIRLVQNLLNCGVGMSRRIGSKLARGKYIAVMDADDIAFPYRLSTQFKYLEKNSKVGLTGSWGEIININGHKEGVIKHPINYKIIKLFLIKDNCFIHSSVFYRAAFIKHYHIRYAGHLKGSDDYDFIVRCSRKFQITNIDDTLIQYRFHPTQVSTKTRDLQIQEADQVRLNQLNRFRIRYSIEEKNLHLKIMQLQSLNEAELQQAALWFDKLLAANSKQNLYHHTSFYNFLKRLLNYSVQTSLKQ